MEQDNNTERVIKENKSKSITTIGFLMIGPTEWGRYRGINLRKRYDLQEREGGSSTYVPGEYAIFRGLI